MNNLSISDTIAAVATAAGESGIGIVRISGQNALTVADKVFVSKDGRKPSQFKTYTTHYGWIVSGPQEVIDEVILTIMRAPRSYTKEDVVEINCHGGIVALRKALDLVLDNGCRLAEPGEFTKRAFLNGRIDLAQAEAVIDIIRAKTDTSLKIGIEQLKGALSLRLDKIRKALLDNLCVLEANIDFPEEGNGEVNLSRVYENLSVVDEELKGIIDASGHARVMREGMQTVICGRPNVGKSSLLNALLKHERSIVSSIPGTTRDTIEEIIDIKGIPVKIVDTAGILEPQDLIERKAMQRSKRQIGLAQLAILMFDGSRKLTKDDWTLIRKLKKKTCIAAINKIDLKQKIERDKIAGMFQYTVDISAKKFISINVLEEAIANLVYNGKVSAPEPIWVGNLRHIESLKNAQKLIALCLSSLDNKLPQEFIAQDLKGAVSHIDDISGKNFSQDLLDRIFSEFCIGK